MIPARETSSKTDQRGSVTYRTEEHIAILCQMYGSVWRKVIPYCLVNVVLAIIVDYCHLSTRIGFSMDISDKGHSFLSIMVSFLVVTRSKIAYQRYMQSRQFLSDIMRSCRELVQHAVTFTRYETHKRAKSWRTDISRRTCSILRTVVAVLEYDTKGQHAWQVSELSKDEKQALLLSVGGSNERSPLVLAIFLRTSIASHKECLHEPLDVNKELKLLDCTSEFITAYHGLMILSTTPFPFPLVQMTRTITFVWVFTLAFALNSTIGQMIPLVVVVFFLTYGFIGLEFVCIELDNPFGDDPNDFDARGLAEVVFDDILISIHDIDGKEAADSLQRKIDMPLSEQVKKDVTFHRRFTRMDSWRKIDTDSLDTAEFDGDESISLLESVDNNDGGGGAGQNDWGGMRNRNNHRGVIASAPPSRFGHRKKESISDESLPSSILQTVRERTTSDDSIEVFGADERVKLDVESGRIIIKYKKKEDEEEG